MNTKDILLQFQSGKLSIEDALSQLKGIQNIDIASIDTNRKHRNGFPEVIYGEGKTADQIIKIINVLLQENFPILTTRVSQEKGQILKNTFENGIYFEQARCFVINPIPTVSDDYIAIVTAGTSDIPVAEEAAVTAETFGHKVMRIYDVGVAGIHRLFNRLDDIKNASVIIVIAGMEGALVSVVGGLVDVPVIAVPTSVGYGSNLGGLTTLMSMLTSCASGVTVVNIDNGFGASYSACMINKIRQNSRGIK